MDLAGSNVEEGSGAPHRAWKWKLATTRDYPAAGTKAIGSNEEFEEGDRQALASGSREKARQHQVTTT